jgi:hypothetical protein
MKQSPARVLLILFFVFVGCFGIAYAAAGMLTALPAPAIGGTCGPSTASETALQALTQPGSIGAGPQPSTSNVPEHRQWATFIHQCQALADHRGLTSLAIFVVSLVVAGVGLLWVLRRNRVDDDADRANGEPGAPVYSPLGLHDPAALVGAGAAVGAPGGAWPPGPQPGYTAPPPYPGPPVPPAYPGPPGGTSAPQPAWPDRSGSLPVPPTYPAAPAYPIPPTPVPPPQPGAQFALPTPPVPPAVPPTVGHEDPAPDPEG